MYTKDGMRERRIPKKGTPFMRVLSTKVENGREKYFHATKGWRDRRLVDTPMPESNDVVVYNPNG